MPKVKAVSPVLYNKLWDTGEVFEVPADLAERLVANGAAVIYTEPADQTRLGGSSGITETDEGAATKAPPAAPAEEEKPKRGRK